MWKEYIEQRKNIVYRNGILIPLTEEELNEFSLSVKANEGKEMLLAYIDKFNEEDKELLLDFAKDEWNCVSFYHAVWEICMEALGPNPILGEMSAIIKELKEKF